MHPMKKARLKMEPENYAIHYRVTQQLIPVNK